MNEFPFDIERVHEFGLPKLTHLTKIEILVGNTDKQGFTKLIAKVFSFPEHNGKRQQLRDIRILL